MIDAVFFHNGLSYTGFEISGHAFSVESGNDLVCCAVSSAVYLTVNGIGEIVQAPFNVAEKNGYMHFDLHDDNDCAQMMVKSLALHLKELSKMYNDNIRVRTKITR